jgi:hypothetical protein
MVQILQSQQMWGLQLQSRGVHQTPRTDVTQHSTAEHSTATAHRRMADTTSAAGCSSMHLTSHNTIALVNWLSSSVSRSPRERGSPRTWRTTRLLACTWRSMKPVWAQGGV